MNIAETPKLWNHPYYEKIKVLLAELTRQNLVKNGEGFCFAMSELIYHRLGTLGIKSKIIECELTITCSNPHNFIMVGHKDGVPNGPNKVNTHVVVLVEHPDLPLLIDASIGHILPDPFQWVCGLASDSVTIGDYSRDAWHLTYREKTDSQFPAIHQRSVVDRMLLDSKIDDIIKQFKIFKIWFAVMLIVITVAFASNRKIILEENQQIVVLQERTSHQQGVLRDLQKQFFELQHTLIKEKK
jgi:cell division protein FtsL